MRAQGILAYFVEQTSIHNTGLSWLEIKTTIFTVDHEGAILKVIVAMGETSQELLTRSVYILSIWKKRIAEGAFWNMLGEEIASHAEEHPWDMEPESFALATHPAAVSKKILTRTADVWGHSCSCSWTRQSQSILLASNQSSTRCRDVGGGE